MEILKSNLSNEIVKIELGTECDQATQKITGDLELDIENQGQFIDYVNTLFQEGLTKVIVDMGNICYIDSSGLWSLFEAHKKAIQHNGQIVLFNTTKDVKRILDITKISSKMSISDTEKDAFSLVST